MSRPLFLAALIVGISYWVADPHVAPGVLHVAWKGAGVGLLALWAACSARSRDGWLLATVLAFGATGDVLLELVGLVAGAIAFLAGHLVAVGLYLRHRRHDGAAAAAAILVATPLVAALLSRDLGVAVYATGLGAMAASAWASRFPRAQVGAGALLFVLSDWLIFAHDPLPGLIWPTYFAGQALIAWGVATTLEEQA